MLFIYITLRNFDAINLMCMYKAHNKYHWETGNVYVHDYDKIAHDLVKI